MQAISLLIKTFEEQHEHSYQLHKVSVPSHRLITHLCQTRPFCSYRFWSAGKTPL